MTKQKNSKDKNLQNMSKALLIVHILNLRIKLINCICNIYSYKPKPTTGFQTHLTMQH